MEIYNDSDAELKDELTSANIFRVIGPERRGKNWPGRVCDSWATLCRPVHLLPCLVAGPTSAVLLNGKSGSFIMAVERIELVQGFCQNHPSGCKSHQMRTGEKFRTVWE